MPLLQIAGRLLLALAFVASSWEDVLPGIEGDASRSLSSPLPSAEGNEEAGEGDVFTGAPGFDLAALIQFESQLIKIPARQVHSSLVIRRIPHVPKPALHV